jgi:tRNA modification GTPase
MPGTTRDYIEECFIYDKTMFRLTDTAGLRETGEEVEHEGIRRSRMKMAEADLMLYMLDIGSDRLEEEIGDIIDIRQRHPEARLIIIANKVDRTTGADALIEKVAQETFAEVIGISALEGEGIDHLKERMGDLVKDLDKLHEASVLVTSLRHYEALRNAADALQNARELIDTSSETELIAFELRSALDYVGEITGKVVNEEVLNMIFDRFCIGK